MARLIFRENDAESASVYNSDDEAIAQAHADLAQGARAVVRVERDDGSVITAEALRQAGS